MASLWGLHLVLLMDCFVLRYDSHLIAILLGVTDVPLNSPF